MKVSIYFKDAANLELAKLLETEVPPLRILKVVIENRISKERIFLGGVFDGIPVRATQEEVHLHDLVFE